MRTRPPSGRAAVTWSLAAATLILGSAALQLVASLQRWVVLRDSWTRADFTIEDHRFDCSFPADPWEHLGLTAQVFGAGSLLLGFGVVTMARAVEGRVAGLEGLLAVGPPRDSRSRSARVRVRVIDAPRHRRQAPAVAAERDQFVGLGILPRAGYASRRRRRSPACSCSVPRCRATCSPRSRLRPRSPATSRTTRPRGRRRSSRCGPRSPGSLCSSRSHQQLARCVHGQGGRSSSRRRASTRRRGDANGLLGSRERRFTSLRVTRQSAISVPPSMTMFWPVTNPPADDASHTTAPATSSTRPNRRSGVRSRRIAESTGRR